MRTYICNIIRCTRCVLCFPFRCKSTRGKLIPIWYEMVIMYYTQMYYTRTSRCCETVTCNCASLNVPETLFKGRHRHSFREIDNTRLHNARRNSSTARTRKRVYIRALCRGEGNADGSKGGWRRKGRADEQKYDFAIQRVNVTKKKKINKKYS